jgi:hypothetical protein
MVLMVGGCGICVVCRPFIIPRKRNRFLSSSFSQYANIEETKYFLVRATDVLEVWGGMSTLTSDSFLHLQN